MMMLADNPMPAQQGVARAIKSFGNVLVIEDDPDTADTIATILRRDGYSVRAVGTRDDALATLAAYLYNVVIMDLNMPGLSAADFMKEVRYRCPGSKFILITAAERVSEQAKALGICHTIGKPFDPDDLLAAVKKCGG